MKGVNFGGVQDKMYTPMPNEGTKCAYPKCPAMGVVNEGMPARFAHNDTTLWCHRACADRWEGEEPHRATKVEEPVEAKPPCAAPHPELHDYICGLDEGHGPYHNSGAGHSWYMQPAQVLSMKAAIAQRNQASGVVVEQTQPSAEELSIEYAATDLMSGGPGVATDDFSRSRNDLGPEWPPVITADGADSNIIMTGPTAPGAVEDPTKPLADDHRCCEHCGPNGHAPHTSGCPPVEGVSKEVFDAEIALARKTNEAFEFGEGVPPGLSEVIAAKREEISAKLVDYSITKEQFDRQPSNVVKLTFELVGILKNHGIDNNDLVAELMDWRAR